MCSGTVLLSFQLGDIPSLCFLLFTCILRITFTALIDFYSQCASQYPGQLEVPVSLISYRNPVPFVFPSLFLHVF